MVSFLMGVIAAICGSDEEGDFESEAKDSAVWTWKPQSGGKIQMNFNGWPAK